MFCKLLKEYGWLAFGAACGATMLAIVLSACSIPVSEPQPNQLDISNLTRVQQINVPVSGHRSIIVGCDGTTKVFTHYYGLAVSPNDPYCAL